MRERLLFLTGHLAAPRLERVLQEMTDPPFEPSVRNIGVKVAALMTTEIILGRLGEVGNVDRVLLPGRFKGDLAALQERFGVPFERGPDELADLPRWLGQGGKPLDLSQHECRIFAEIVEAPGLDIGVILERARALRAQGADVVDLGCLPGTPFPLLEEAVQTLVAEGLTASVDSGDPEELRRGARAGAGYLLSLDETTLDLAFETAATPVLIPTRHGDLPSLLRACERLDKAGLPYLADPILDPIHMGFVDSLDRYRQLRQRLPEAEILMGIGNLTELTDADTTGITMTLMGIVSELGIGNVLVVQVSPHCRRAVVEADMARRILHAAKQRDSLPQWLDPALMALRDRLPFPDTTQDIARNAAAVTDRNFRIQIAEDGIHVYNGAGHQLVTDPFAAFAGLEVAGDGGHAFYLGVELARAQIAWQLGKRYVQDNQLRWGCAVDPPVRDSTHLEAAGATLPARRRRPKEP